MKDIQQSKKKTRSGLGFLLIIMLMFGGCFGDRMVASVLFKKYCSELAGFTLYEKVELGDEYFLPYTEKNTSEYRRLDSYWFFDDEHYLNAKKIEQEFKFTYLVRKELSSLGPVASNTTVIKRLSDNKVLSEVISISNSTGWLANIGPLPPITYSCPDDEIWENNLHHPHSIKNTFGKITRN